PRRGVVLADPRFLVAELVQPSQRLQIPVVTLLQSAFRRMGRHREISDFHGASSLCVLFESASVARQQKHSTPGVWPRYDESDGQKFARRSDARAKEEARRMPLPRSERG